MPALLEALLDLARCALLATDGDGRCVYANAAARALTGFGADTIGSAPLDQQLRGGAPGRDGPVAMALAAGAPVQGEDVFVRPDGGGRLVAWTATPIQLGAHHAGLGEHGTGVVIVMHDLQNERRLAEALSESEARYRFMTETLPIQIWTALPDGSLDYVTEQTARHLGLTADRLLAEGWQNVVHPDDLGPAVEAWLRALSTGETYEVEFRLKLADETHAAHLARAVPQRDEQGNIVRWFGTNTNIVEQREQQRRTEALLAEVVMQTRESEEALREMQRALDVAQARIRELEAQSGP